MFILDKIEIDALWGQRSLRIDCHSDVNFFIGVNGSGKTTVVNLIAAALKLDYVNLSRVDFKRLLMKLRNPRDGSTGLLKVTRNPSESSRFSTMEYEVRIGKEPAERFILDEHELMRLRHATARTRKERERLYLERGNFEIFRTHLNVSWLSIHRAELSDPRHEDVSFESSVDKKLAQLSNDFVRYFSALTALANGRTEQFQKQVFLTLLIEPSKGLPKLTVDYSPDRESLKEILSSLNLLNTQSSKALSKLFRTIDRAKLEYERDEAIGDENIAALFAADQIHRVVPLWNMLVKDKADINRTRDEFIDVLNGLLIKKKLRISDENVLQAITDDERVLRLTELSSGEKQLVIILGEALLNQRGPWIYIADEPELSLHVNWQEQLIGSLLKVNPSAQLLFATHSPDIVSVYQDRVFDMEKVLK